jgi:hypothetical protein
MENKLQSEPQVFNRAVFSQKKMYEMPDSVVNEFLTGINLSLRFERFQLENVEQTNQLPGQLRGILYTNDQGKTAFLPFSNPHFMKYAYSKGYDIAEALDANISVISGMAQQSKMLEQVVNEVVDIVLSPKGKSFRFQITTLTEFLESNLKITKNSK